MTTLALAFAVILVGLTSVIRAAGASLVRTPRADALHDAAEGDERAALVAELLDDRPRIQPALAAYHTGLLVAAAMPASWALARLLDGWPLLVALVIVGILFVFIGDLIPRIVGRSRPRVLAYRFAGLLHHAVTFGEAAADFISDLDEDEHEEVEDVDTEDDERERELITSVLEFTDTLVREVMVPRTDMITIRADDSTDEALDLVIAEGRSRVPVVGEGIDDVVGVLYARDLLELLDRGEGPISARDVMRPAYLVPESKRVAELLREMQGNRVHMAIVVDEFGGTSGLVTIEDLLEELVGEIVDEYDSEEPMVTELGSGEFLVDARLGVDQLAAIIGSDLPADEWDTVGGLVLSLAGRVPREGEAFELDHHVFVADRVQGRRVARVRLTPRR
ncbi:MAG TPA: hemolysin family protein [Acidimicrobiia bacterium]|jgi:CBS domain containing-hemolysin-like protein